MHPDPQFIYPDAACSINGRGFRNAKWIAQTLADPPAVMFLIDDDTDDTLWLHLILSEEKLREMLMAVESQRSPAVALADGR